MRAKKGRTKEGKRVTQTGIKAQAGLSFKGDEERMQYEEQRQKHSGGDLSPIQKKKF